MRVFNSIPLVFFILKHFGITCILVSFFCFLCFILFLLSFSFFDGLGVGGWVDLGVFVGFGFFAGLGVDTGIDVGVGFSGILTADSLSVRDVICILLSVWGWAFHAELLFRALLLWTLLFWALLFWELLSTENYCSIDCCYSSQCYSAVHHPIAVYYPCVPFPVSESYWISIVLGPIVLYRSFWCVVSSLPVYLPTYSPNCSDSTAVPAIASYCFLHFLHQYQNLPSAWQR